MSSFMWLGAAMLVAFPVVGAFVVMSWWAVADLRDWWRKREEAYCIEHDEEYEAPELPASRPSLGGYMRALTVVVLGGPILVVALVASDVGYASGVLAYCTVRAARELRKQLRAMKDRAADRVPTL